MRRQSVGRHPPVRALKRAGACYQSRPWRLFMPKGSSLNPTIGKARRRPLVSRDPGRMRVWLTESLSDCRGAGRPSHATA
ncbi:MAG: hypothetical protein ACRESP_08700 [Pseudomonas sp.]